MALVHRVSAIAPVLADDAGFLLVRCSAEVVRSANHALEEMGLRVRHMVLLKLAAQDGGIPQRQIVDDLGLDPSAVVNLIDDLAHRDLVERRPNPDDRRSRVVAITTAGRAMLRRASEAVDTAQDVLFTRLPAEDREALARILRAILGG